MGKKMNENTTSSKRAPANLTQRRVKVCVSEKRNKTKEEGNKHRHRGVIRVRSYRQQDGIHVHQQQRKKKQKRVRKGVCRPDSSSPRHINTCNTVALLRCLLSGPCMCFFCILFRPMLNVVVFNPETVTRQ
jgi:hypothetical protein